MSIYNSKLWISDIDEIMKNAHFLSALVGKSILITGAAGLICSAITDILIRYNETHKNKINIYAAGRTVEEMQSRFGEYFEKEYFRFALYDALKEDNKFDFSSDYIIHGAGNAFPAVISKEPVETLCGSITGVKNLFDYAKANGTNRVLYISSSEVYGIKNDNKPYVEDDYGYVDILNPRNSYSVGKRAAETLCASYSTEYGVDSVIVRPGHIYGPTALPQDNRVSSEWAYSAARGEDIVMKSDGSQIRSYCYCLDCASAILTVLLKGKRGKAYNISNPNSIISIKEMAEILANTAGVKLIREEATNAEKKQFNPMDNSSLDSKSLQRLGWKGLWTAETGLTHTVEILKYFN